MLLLILFLLPLLALSQVLIHAPYQVGIFLFDNYNPNFNEKNYPICSAAIVHPLFCVTTADCVHAHITAHNIVRPFSPKSLYIKSGNFSEIRENIKYVKEIFIHPEFNSSTMQNDIAILQVEASFQFIHPYNEQWIELPDRHTSYAKCVFTTSSSNIRTTNDYPFSELKPTTVVNNSICNGNDAYYLPYVNNINLCSFYEFDHPFMCRLPESQLRLNRDRGTPIICDNKVAGLLSVIIPANVTNSTDTCSKTLKTYAYYTRVFSFEKWIRSIIGVKSPEHTADGNAIPFIPNSPPYENYLTVSKPGGIMNGTVNITPNLILMALISFIARLLLHKF